MKSFLLGFFLLVFTMDLAAQVIFRKDFIINRKEARIERKGPTVITINLDDRTNWNQLINGRGGRCLVIDVRALTGRKREFTYTEIAEKVYVPNLVGVPSFRSIPVFLLISPPHITAPLITYRSVTKTYRPGPGML